MIQQNHKREALNNASFFFEKKDKKHLYKVVIVTTLVYLYTIVESNDIIIHKSLAPANQHKNRSDYDL